MNNSALFSKALPALIGLIGLALIVTIGIIIYIILHPHLRKLIFREAIVHRTRLLLSLAAIVATSCMVVWLIGGFDQMAAEMRDSADNYLGSYQLVLSPPAGMSGAPGMGGGRPGGPGMGKPGGARNGQPAKAPGARPMPANPRNALDARVFGLLRNDSQVEAAHGAMQVFGINTAVGVDDKAVYDRMRQRLGIPPSYPLIVGIDTSVSPFKLEEGKWFSTLVTGYPKSVPTPIECVIGSAAARTIKPLTGLSSKKDDRDYSTQPGTVIQFYNKGVEIKATVVGTFEQGIAGGNMMSGMRRAPGMTDAGSNAPPQGVSITQGSIYMPLGAAAKIAGTNPHTDLIYIRLKEGVNVEQFKSRMSEQLKALFEPQFKMLYRMQFQKQFAEKLESMPEEESAALFDSEYKKYKTDNFESMYNGSPNQLIFQDVHDVAQGLVGNQTPGAILAQAYSSIGLVLIASIFIIFTTLSMGVNERTRQLALLRCIGLNRRQIVTLIMGESLLLGVFGAIGGMAAGYGLLWAGQAFNGHQAAVALSPLCVVVTASCSMLGAFLAGLIPAWRAARIKPLDAVEQSAALPSHSWAIPSAVIGLILISLCPIIVYVIPVSIKIKAILYGAVGMPTLALGCLLIIPAMTIISEKLFGALCARALGLSPVFLSGQLSRSLWRSVGTVISLAIGLGLYCFFEIWGYSMLVPFTPTRDMPDTLTAFMPQGITALGEEKVKACPAVNQERFLALQVEHAMFTKDQMKILNPSGGRDMNDNMVICGVDVAKSFEGSNPMFKLKFAEGNEKEAIAKLKSDKRYCLVMDSFAVPRETHVGDTLQFRIPDSNVTSLSGGVMEMYEGEKAESGEEKTVSYEVAGVLSFSGWQWLVKTSGLRFRQGRGSLMFCRDSLVYETFNTPEKDRRRFYWFDPKPGVMTTEQIESYMQKIAQSDMTDSATSAVSESAAPESAVEEAKGFVKISTIDTLNDFLNKRADSVIQSMAKMPLMILIITTIAVINTIVASVRTRRWEIGLLRSISLTRSQVARLILAESLLIALTACFVSFVLGTIAAWCSIGVSSSGAFGTVNVPLTMPWIKLGFGFGLTIALCLTAAVWTSLLAAREDPAALLSGDR